MCKGRAIICEVLRRTAPGNGLRPPARRVRTSTAVRRHSPVAVRRRDPEAVLQSMSSGCRIELALDVVTVFSAESSPRCDGTGVPGRIEAVGQQDSNDVADQVAIVEVVPDEDFDGETGVA